MSKPFTVIVPPKSTTAATGHIITFAIDYYRKTYEVKWVNIPNKGLFPIAKKDGVEICVSEIPRRLSEKFYEIAVNYKLIKGE